MGVKSLKNQAIRINQAVILAGGKGIRLRPITNDLPKPLVPVNGIPFLNYLFQPLIEKGITKILLLVGYKNELFLQQYGDTLSNGVKVEYSIGTAEDQTGRRLLNAYTLLDEHFLLMYGDNYWPIALSKMTEAYNKTNVAVLATVFNNSSGNSEYGLENNIEVDENFMVRTYDKSRKSKTLNGVDIGSFIVQRTALYPNTKDNLSFEEDIFSEWVRQQQAMAWVTNTQYYYITDEASLRVFEQFAGRSGLKHIQSLSCSR